MSIKRNNKIKPIEENPTEFQWVLFEKTGQWPIVSNFNILERVAPDLVQWTPLIEDSIAALIPSSRTVTREEVQAIQSVLKNLDSLFGTKDPKEVFKSGKVFYKESFKNELDCFVGSITRQWPFICMVFEEIRYKLFTKDVTDCRASKNGIKNPFSPWGTILHPSVWEAHSVWYLLKFDRELSQIKSVIEKIECLPSDDFPHTKTDPYATTLHVRSARFFLQLFEKHSFPKNLDDLVRTPDLLRQDDFINLLNDATKQTKKMFYKQMSAAFCDLILEKYSEPDRLGLPVPKSGVGNPFPLEFKKKDKVRTDVFDTRHFDIRLCRFLNVIEIYDRHTRSDGKERKVLREKQNVIIIFRDFFRVYGFDPEDFATANREFTYEDALSATIGSKPSKSGEADWKRIVDAFELYLLKTGFDDKNGYRRIRKGLRNPFVRGGGSPFSVGKGMYKIESICLANKQFSFWVPKIYAFKKSLVESDITRAQVQRKLKAIFAFFYFSLPFLNADPSPLSVMTDRTLSKRVRGHFSRIFKDYDVDEYINHVHDFLLFVRNNFYLEFGIDESNLSLTTISIERANIRIEAVGAEPFESILESFPFMSNWIQYCRSFLKESNSTLLDAKIISLRFLIEFFIAHEITDPVKYILDNKIEERFIPYLESAKYALSSPSAKSNVRHAFNLLEFIRKDISGEDYELLGNNPFTRVRDEILGIPTDAKQETTKTILSARLLDDFKETFFSENFSSFSDLTILQEIGSKNSWVEVDKSVIDEEDPDCVFRKKTEKRIVNRTVERNEWAQVEVYEIWDPTTSMVLFLNTHTPLRNKQIRALDSGEGDTYKFVIKNGKGTFVKNDNPLSKGTVSKPMGGGVFNIEDFSNPQAECMSLKINTNKTADIGKSENDKGYVTPLILDREKILFWMEKLRNWQEKYNPISSPTSWSDCANRLGKFSEKVASRRRPVHFLFRQLNPMTEGRTDIPVGYSMCEHLWFAMNRYLEEKLQTERVTTPDGFDVQLIDKSGIQGYGRNRRKERIVHTIHSLRPSVLTFMIVDLGLPVHLVSKLVAGHSSIMMTIYYTKLNSQYIRDVISSLDEKKLLDAKKANSLRLLKQSNHDSMKRSFASLYPEQAYANASQSKNTSGYAITPVGVCPNGMTLCNAGGELDNLTEEGRVTNESRRKAVPGFPQERNCVLCRFNISTVSDIFGIKMELDSATLESHDLSAELGRIESTIKNYAVDRAAAMSKGDPFTREAEYTDAKAQRGRLLERFSVLLTKINACISLINTLVEIANAGENSEGMALASLGGEEELRIGLSLTEGTVHQLSSLLLNSEFYQLAPSKHIGLKGAKMMDQVLRFNGLPPVFFELPEDQQEVYAREFLKKMLAHTKNNSIGEIVPFLERRDTLDALGIKEEMSREVRKIENILAIHDGTKDVKKIGLTED